MSESAKRHEENFNLIKEIRATTDAAIRDQGASIKTFEIQIGQMSKILQERGFGSLASSTKTNPRDQVKSISTTIEADSHSITQPVLDHLNTPYPLDRTEKSRNDFNAHSLRKVRQLNKLRRNQGDDLMPTIEEGEVIVEFRTRDEDLDIGIDDYPSYCDDEKKIHIDYAHNLKFSCMIEFEFTHFNFNPLLYVNVISRKFHNSIMKDKIVYKGDNVVGALMNVPIFVGTFSVMTDFVVLKDMDAYRAEGMGDIIVGEPFLREVGIKAKRFEGIITLYNGDDEVTYQMVRSHPRFKNHTNEQCNKIPSILKEPEPNNPITPNRPNQGRPTLSTIGAIRGTSNTKNTAKDLNDKARKSFTPADSAGEEAERPSL
ncbi:hypothetical protein Tco_0255074 [Tanacetum coccineum]